MATTASRKTAATTKPATTNGAASSKTASSKTTKLSAGSTVELGTFDFDRETKNMVRYAQEDADGRALTYYVPKSKLGATPPKAINISFTVA